MANPDFDSIRRAMVDSQLRTSGVTEGWILAAMGSAPRESYVPGEFAATCYNDRPVWLGNGRAINPPLVTALMLQAAEVQPDDHVLLIGDASGYIAHLLKTRTANVTSVDAGADGKDGAYDLVYIDGAVEQLPGNLIANVAAGGRIVTGLIDGTVTRLAIGYVRNGRVAMRPFADAEIVRLPAFAAPKEFVF